MYNFKNVALQREHKNLLSGTVNVKKGTLGGYSIEIETKNPEAYETYLYKGNTAEKDRDSDFKNFQEMLNKSTN
jgi:hypothetical protein